MAAEKVEFDTEYCVNLDGYCYKCHNHHKKVWSTVNANGGICEYCQDCLQSVPFAGFCDFCHKYQLSDKKVIHLPNIDKSVCSRCCIDYQSRSEYLSDTDVDIASKMIFNDGMRPAGVVAVLEKMVEVMFFRQKHFKGVMEDIGKTEVYRAFCMFNRAHDIKHHIHMIIPYINGMHAGKIKTLLEITDKHAFLVAFYD